MIAFILAGGKGTRFKEVTKDVLPKPMVNIAGKPILQYQIEFLARNNINKVIISVGYKAEIIKDYFKEGKQFGVSIIYSEESKALGTAGAFKYAESLFNKEREENILVIYGDIIFDIDLERMLNFHKCHNGLGTLFVHPNDHPYDSDLLEINQDDRVIKFINKPHPKELIYQNLVNAGLYILKSEILHYIPCKQKLDFEKDIFPKIIDKKKYLYAYNSPEYLKDMGTPDRYNKVKDDILNGKVHRKNLKNKQKVVFLDRDGVINKEVDLLYKPEQLKLISGVEEAIKQLNSSDYLVVITTNQPVVARGFCTEEGVREIHKKLETLLSRQGAYTDRIYYCPHHPDKGYPEENEKYKIKCNCRKPKIGMFLQAEKDLNISKEESFMIGDTTTDIQTGKNYGIRTILVKTGYKGLDKKFSVKPDYIFQDLKEAVDFLLSAHNNI
jgi:histidinol-phosphate phosphatase family protein